MLRQPSGVAKGYPIMLPVIALLGRSNVGKSTLFNHLTGTRDALVADTPGLTRDRQYGYGQVGPVPYVIVDSGGLLGDKRDGITALTEGQSLLALQECDVVIFMVDGRDGLLSADSDLAEAFRRTGKPVQLAVNKSEGMDVNSVTADFHSLGLGEPIAISATHGDRVEKLMESVLAGFPSETLELPDHGKATRVAVVGRPNVGKSTLINRLLGEDRLVAFEEPGTTRDSVEVPFERDDEQYILVDTAGVRRRSKVRESIEKFSVIKSLQAIDAAHVVIVLMDASEGVTDQDLTVLGHVLERGRALVLALNKWDGLSPNHRERVRTQIALKLNFTAFARTHFISALHGSGVGDLLGSVNEARDAAMRELSTPELTRILEQAVSQHQPPLVRGRRIKLRYAHQGGRLPPVIVIHGNQVKQVPEAYRRYLVNIYRDRCNLHGTPVRIEFKSGENPFQDRKNILTPRQRARKKRLMKHVKGKRK